MRVVLDTNVLVSALIKSGKPRSFLKAMLRPDHALILSEPIIEEFSRVTADEKIKRYADDEAVEKGSWTCLRGAWSRDGMEVDF